MHHCSTVLRFLISLLIALLPGVPIAAQGFIDTQPVMRYGRGGLVAAALSPDGERLATTGVLGVSIWDLETSTVLRVIDTTSVAPDLVVWSPAGDRIAVASSGPDISLFDVATGEVLRILQEPSGADIDALAFSPDGTRILSGSAGVSGGDNGNGIIWNIDSGTIARTIQPAIGALGGVAWNPAGTEVVLCGPSSSRIFRVSSGLSLRSLPAGGGAAYNGAGTLLALGTPASLYDTASGTQIWTSQAMARGAAFSADESLVLFKGCVPPGIPLADGIDIRRTLNGGEVYSRNTPKQVVMAEWLPTPEGDAYIHAWRDGSVIISRRTLPYDSPTRMMLPDLGSIESVDYGLDPRFPLVRSSSTVGVVDLERAVNDAVKFSPDESFTTEGLRGEYFSNPDFAGTPAIIRQDQWFSLRQNSFPTGFPTQYVSVRWTGFIRPRVSGEHLFALQASASGSIWLDGQIVANSSEQVTQSTRTLEAGRLYAIQLELGHNSGWEPLFAFTVNPPGFLTAFEGGHSSAVTDLVVTADGSRIVSADSGGSIVVWDAPAGALIRRIVPETPAQALAISRDGRRFATDDSAEGVQVWDTESGLLVQTMDTDGGTVHGLDFSPDGNRVVAGSDIGRVRSWDVETGELLSSWTVENSNIITAKYTPDGTKLVTCSDRVRFWNAADLAPAGELDVPLSGFGCFDFAFSPSGDQLLVALNGEAVLIDLQAGEISRTHETNGRRVAFAPDGQHYLIVSPVDLPTIYSTSTGQIAWSGDEVSNAADFQADSTVALADQVGNILLRDSESGVPRGTLRAVFTPTASAISPDGSLVATGQSDGTILVWDRWTREVKAEMLAHTGSVKDLAFSSDGQRLLSGSEDRSARLWEVASGNQLRRFDGHAGEVSAVVFLPDERSIATGSTEEAALKLWSIDTGTSFAEFAEYSDELQVSPDGGLLASARYGEELAVINLQDLTVAKEGIVNQGKGEVAFSASGSRIAYNPAASEDVGVGFHDLVSDEYVRSIPLRGRGRYTFAFSPNKLDLLSGDPEGTLTLTPLNEPEPALELREFTNAVASVAFRSVGTDGGLEVATIGRSDNSRLEIRRWEMATGEGLSVRALPSQARSFLLPSNPNRFATVGDRTVDLYDVRNPSVPLAHYDLSSQHASALTAVAFSRDGSLMVTGDGANVAIVWDAATGEPLNGFGEHTGSILSLDISQDGTRVLSASQDQSARIWDAQTGIQSVLVDGAGSDITRAVFSPDGQTFLVASGTALRLFAAATGVLQWEVPSAHIGIIHDAVFSEDGHRIATASEDKTAKVWATADLSELRILNRHVGAVTSLALSPDGSRLLTGSDDGLTFLWDTGPAPETGPITPTIRTKDKILIVAGGGAYTGNGIARQTRGLAEFAHYAATLRGYDADAEIMYLSAFPTIPRPTVDDPLREVENTKVDNQGPPTKEDVASAITGEWARDARRLILIFLDHGERSGGEVYFLIDGTTNPRQLISASELDALLDEAQSGPDPLDEAILYVDMCYAGGFLTRCAEAPTAQTARYVIASTSIDRLASFGGSTGQLSFSGFFLSAALQGSTLHEAFIRASEAIKALGIPSAAPQNPAMDDDGDGVYTGLDGLRLRLHVLGAVPAFGNLPPQITDTRGDLTLPEAQDVELYAEMGSGGVDEVRVFVCRRGASFDPTQPITDYVELLLTREGTGNRWSGTLGANAFPYRGTYTVLYTAAKNDSLLPELSLQAEPVEGSIVIETGEAPSPVESWMAY
ncbi:PQQ-binding-like beta-propeller repeat protein [bacterium]|nr:PQQ-binding-like beta-propeller repeat protein [bacterium]